MKKSISLMLAVFALSMSSVGACLEQGRELIVFAAASMTETLTELAPAFEVKNPGVRLVFNFDSSGTLKTQIEEGAACDVFISAGRKQMDQLDALADSSVNPDGLDMIEAGTRVNLLENRVVLVVPEGNPKRIESFDMLKEKLESGDALMAMGNSDVPVGQYTQRILAHFGLDERELAKSGVLTYGTNAKEVTTQVSYASVDCGVVYATDAFSAELTVVGSATDEMCGQVIYPAAVVKGTKEPELARAYLNDLMTDEAMQVFESVGFSSVN